MKLVMQRKRKENQPFLISQIVKASLKKLSSNFSHMTICSDKRFFDDQQSRFNTKFFDGRRDSLMIGGWRERSMSKIEKDESILQRSIKAEGVD